MAKDRFELLGRIMHPPGVMLLAGLALSAASQPDRWVRVGGSDGTHEEYLDRASLTRSGDKVTLWTRRDLAESRGTAWHEIEFDCSARTKTILAYVMDDRGTISHNIDRPHRKAAPIAPGSVSERLFAIACR